MQDNSWIKNLKPGDKVGISCGLGGREIKLGIVEKITPTGRVIVQTRNGFKTNFNPDGSERGGILGGTNIESCRNST